MTRIAGHRRRTAVARSGALRRCARRSARVSACPSARDVMTALPMDMASAIVVSPAPISLSTTGTTTNRLRS